MLSAHTSPLEQPGTGDAGGMNVYVLHLAKHLAHAGIDVEIFTRATSRHQPEVHEPMPGVTVRHVPAGPFDGLTKEDLPAQMCSFVRDVQRVEVERGQAPAGRGWFDLVHSHYWLSGQVGTVVADRWGVPLVHSMHTMAKVKNARLAVGDRPEPAGRIAAEEEIVRLADRLVANTDEERRELIELYGADPERVEVIHPGVDSDVFVAGRQHEARQRLGIDPGTRLLTFAGRIQPLKAPDLLVRAAHHIVNTRPEAAQQLQIAIVGGASGSGLDRPSALADLVTSLGLDEIVRFVPPVRQAELADWYAASDAVCVPSHNESFGLVAIEAQACGTPVVASRVGGLTTAVVDGVTGVLLDTRDPADWADALWRMADDRAVRDTMSVKAAEHAGNFTWEAMAERVLEMYRRADQERR